jgi:hypothetical protein
LKLIGHRWVFLHDNNSKNVSKWKNEKIIGLKHNQMQKIGFGVQV